MRSVISGGALPVLEIALDPGETIVAETGQLSWMSGNVVLETARRRPPGRAASSAR